MGGKSRGRSRKRRRRRGDISTQSGTTVPAGQKRRTSAPSITTAAAATAGDFMAHGPSVGDTHASVFRMVTSSRVRHGAIQFKSGSGRRGNRR